MGGFLKDIYLCVVACSAVTMESACVLGWGRTTEGQLGLGGIEETSISEPRFEHL